MFARKLLYKLMVTGPIAMLASIGIQSRTFFDDYQSPGYSEQENAAITSYVELMRETVPIVHPSEGEPDRAELRRIAQRWIELDSNGELQPLAPNSFEDSLQNGIKGQIFGAKTDMARGLVASARDLAKQERYTEATEDLALALDICEVLKYSDFSTVYEGCFEQKVAMKAFEYIPFSELPEEKETILAALDRIMQKDPPFESMARVARGQYKRSRTEKGEKPNELEEAKWKEVLDHPAKGMLVSRATETPVLYSMVTMGWNAHYDVRERIETFKNEVNQVADEEDLAVLNH